MAMKWVMARDGKYKYVDASDSRPAVKLPDKELGSIFVPFNPSWKQHEKNIWNEDARKSMKATDNFIAEREHEVKTDPKAARWEKSRKAHWDKQKPAWRKWAMKRGIV